jgi:hypothetical protein
LTALLDCPAVSARLDRLQADLLARLGHAPAADELWLLLLGCCPSGAAVDKHAAVLLTTAQYLIDVNDGRRQRNAGLLPLAYPLHATAAPQ